VAWRRLAATALALIAASPAAAVDLIGHGGPVGALDVSGALVVSGSFDTRAILWDATTGGAERVLRFHDGNVTAVAHLPGGGVATGGQDGRVAIWEAEGTRPVFATPHGASQVAALSPSPDGETLAAGFWDGAILALSLDGFDLERWDAHGDRVMGLAHLPDGRLASVGSDLRLAVWGADRTLAARTDLTDLPNGLDVTEGRIAVVFAEGALRLYSPEGRLLPERFLTDRPLVAVTADAGLVAAAAVDGTVWLLEAPRLETRFEIEPGQGPVWALALGADSLFTAGGDGTIRRHSLTDGARLGGVDAPAAEDFDDGSRGAEVWRACAVCHSLDPDDRGRAGPTLHGVFGRRIGTAEGYDYSDALRDLDIVWTPETVAELFEHGPETYTPGTRMPEQRLPDPEDRAALVEFLQRKAH
jgi:cytochrome c